MEKEGKNVGHEVRNKADVDRSVQVNVVDKKDKKKIEQKGLES